MEAISVRNIVKSYGRRRLFDAASLGVPEGARVALYGPTGVGKTTLLYVIAGLVRPDGGTVEFFGEDARADGYLVPPDRRGIGMVFQKALLWPHMRVRANVEFALYSSVLARGDRRERAMEALGLFGVEDLAGRRPETLSGGQVQMVALARSIAARPRILLWDEPFTGLDDETLQRVASTALSYINRTQATLVMVSHRRQDARALEAEVVLLEGGKLVREG